jgi:hypothetical protein
MNRHYQALTAQGAVVEVTAANPVAGMKAAAEHCGANDYPVVLYVLDERGVPVAPVWGGRRGLASEYPEGESPEDARRLFGRGGEPA